VKRSCTKIAVVGLGYVGLPLAVAFGRKLPTVGFDVNGDRIDELSRGIERNGEMTAAELSSEHLTYSNDPASLTDADVIVVAVPTPVEESKRPDLSFVRSATTTVAQHMKSGVTVVYESTVYPGCTEEVCLPILEAESGLVCGTDFWIGYSPERINPGDRDHTLEKIVKIVAGQDAETTDLLADVYGMVVDAGVHRAPTIQTAEAAKVIENVQRDLNIALMNELAMLFDRLGLDTQAVLAAAGTKWNFLPFCPGLVGGHCIPVDPYYLTQKAQNMGFDPQVILAGRRTNDGMGVFIAEKTIRLLERQGIDPTTAVVLVLGLAFKEDVSDVRNTRVVDVIRELELAGCEVVVHDPLVSSRDVERLEVAIVPDPFTADVVYDAVIVAVSHLAFRNREADDYRRILRDGGVFVDIKGRILHALDGSALRWTL